MKIKEVVLKKETYKLEKLELYFSSTKELIVRGKENNRLYNTDVFVCIYFCACIHVLCINICLIPTWNFRLYIIQFYNG